MTLDSKRCDDDQGEQSGLFDQELELLRHILLCRAIDRREAMLMRQGKGRLALSSAGHEGLSVLAKLLQPQDLIFSYYRDRPLLLARGVTPERCASNFFASVESSTQGRSESVLHCDSSLGIFSAAGATGIQCLPAVGAAWSQQLNQTNALVLCTIGDAATRQGEFFEALAFAVQEQLPIVFVVEDNGLGISTRTAGMTPLSLGLLAEHLLCELDARDPMALRAAAEPLFAEVRSGAGPKVLWCHLDRLDSHIGSDDQRVYRDTDELEAVQSRGPLVRLSDCLLSNGVCRQPDIEAFKRQAEEQVDRAYQAAALEQSPQAADIAHQLLAPLPEVTAIPGSPVRSDLTLIEAFNQTLGMALQQDSRVLVFGQDVEDPKGGVFGYTRGLSSRFPGRVVNAPLAEATIIGGGVGLAACGHRPICELQFIDFATPGFHQLANSAANLRWRSHGDWHCPLIIYAPYGAHVNSGFWHAASNESWFAHMPGLRIAIPTTPADAAGLLWTALHAEDPTLLLLPKNAARSRRHTEQFEPIPFGKARHVRHGEQCTLVSWGSTVAVCEQAAEQLDEQGIAVDLIDLRSLVPCDWPTLLESLQRTGRLVVVQEDVRRCGFGQSLISEVCTRSEGFYAFLHEPVLVSRDDTYIGFAPELERAALPRSSEVIEAVKKVVG